jgi:hypothetical protein
VSIGAHDAPRAWTRYAVRFGDTSFIERFLDSVAAFSGDASVTFTTATSPCLRVLEIVDRDRRHVLRRIRHNSDIVAWLYDEISDDLRGLDPEMFEQKWRRDQPIEVGRRSTGFGRANT